MMMSGGAASDAASGTKQPRVLLVADREREDIASCVEIVDRVCVEHASRVVRSEPVGTPLPSDMNGDAIDFAVVVGGDGTIIRQSRRLARRNIPIVGVNVGRLGFLAAFDPQVFARDAAEILSGVLPIEERLLLDCTLLREGEAIESGIAVNDCSISAGAPFRMIELSLEIDGSDGPDLSGDGLIVATPTGSTAYSAAAGGPIVGPGVPAFVLTPVAAHSLAFRPIVVPASSRIAIRVVRANTRTAVVRDGQAVIPLRAGDVIQIERSPFTAKLVQNPHTTYWTMLHDKLHWAVPPRYRG